MKFKNNKKGFTLVELLAVIVILGVLLLIAVPAVQNIIASSRKKAFESAAKLLIENVEATASVEKFNDLIPCYYPIDEIELERGNLGKNFHGFVLVNNLGKGTIYYSNDEYSVTEKTLANVKADASRVTYADAPTTAISSVDKCDW